MDNLILVATLLRVADITFNDLSIAAVLATTLMA